MIRKIILLLLVLGIAAQGASAAVNGSLSCSASNDTGITDLDSKITPTLAYQNYYYSYFGSYTGWSSDSNHDAKITIDFIPNDPGIFSLSQSLASYNIKNTRNISSSGYTPSVTNQFQLKCYARHTTSPAFESSLSFVYSETPLNVASGESCDSLAMFDVYINDTYAFTDYEDGNYSFSIADGIAYKIYHNVSDEWHNFTASGDEEWNPTDICNNADFNFANLSYTSPVKQYLTSNVTVDINDTDGTISSAIARIDGSNYSMQFIGGEKWRYLFTGTNIIKNYYITNIYATDNDGGQDFESYNASYIHVESRTGGGGGGGGSYPSDPTIPPSSEPCTLNCDDNDDGTCDRNCDTDGDGICDVNCDDAADRPIDEDIPDDFKDLFENFRDGDIPDDFWTDKNLRIHPASLNSTAFYTGWDKPQNVTYRFLTNKFIDSCEVTNGSCTIDQRFLVNFNTVIDGNTTGYRGMLTVSRINETAIADININVINLCACKEITPWQLNISDEWAQKLVYFVRVKDGAIVCIRLLFLILLLAVLLGIVFWDSTRKH